MARPYDRIVTKPYLPSRDEIERATAKIRESWSLDEHYRRGLQRPAWLCPAYPDRFIEVDADDAASIV